LNYQSQGDSLMSKKWFFLFAGFSLILGMVLAMGTQATHPTTVVVTQPVPVRAPAPSYIPPRTTPVATTAVSQPSPKPQPAPRPDGVTVNSQPVDAQAAGQLSGFIFLVTVLFVGAVCLSLHQRKQTAHRSYAQPRLAKGMQS
jgi:hypothetical protein